jgi:TPR repeat protein
MVVIGLLAALLLGGCSHFGGGHRQAAADNNHFDLLQLQREQWRQLADQGDAEAEYQLGMSYCCGNGPGLTEAIARKWLCRAALQGNEQAQLQLGRMYGNEIKKRPFSTPQTADYAYLWYSLAAAQGSQLAAGYLTALEEYMSPSQIARAQDWQSHPADVSGCG